MNYKNNTDLTKVASKIKKNLIKELLKSSPLMWTGLNLLKLNHSFRLIQT